MLIYHGKGILAIKHSTQGAAEISATAPGKE
jgi:hypothetical protein